MAGAVVAIDLGGTFIKTSIVLGDTIVCRDRRTTEADHGANAIIESIIELISGLLDRQHLQAGNIDRVGAAVPSRRLR